MTLKELFKVAITKNASDLHLVAGLPPVLRIDGELSYIEKTRKLTSKEIEQLVFSLLDAGQKEKFISNRELDIGLEIDGYRYRVNLHY